MNNSNTQEKANNFILSLLVVLGVYAVGAYFFDFFYDLNDDMAIKDILAGVYTGTPDGHTNQMLYPLGLAISCLYKFLPNVPVFGIFLCACLGISFVMISYRMQGFFRNTRVKAVTTILMILVFLSLMLWELVYVQYSVVCGVLAGTACFWFYTTPSDCSIGEFWKKNFPALFLVWIAFLIRSEMLLLTSPFITAVGIWHWAESTRAEKENYTDIEKKKNWKFVLSKGNICKYIIFVVVMIAGLGIALGADFMTYRDADWQEYRGFFDARTEVYDYTWYPNYGEQKEFYEANGISEMQYRLIDNYNFGLDESITENTLEIIASYGERPKMLGSVSYRMKWSFMELVERSFSLQDAPYNYFVLAGYGLVIGLAVVQKDKKYIWKLLLLVIMRCIPWFYLIYVQRAVERITHPLYVIEFLILLAMLVKELYDRPLWNVEKYYRMAAAGVLTAVAIISLPFGFMEVKSEQVRREQNLEKQNLWDEYAKANPQNYYYMDVYSTISFMEKIFKDIDNSQKNYDLLGGWVCNSPLQEEARGKYVTAIAEEENSSGNETVSDEKAAVENGVMSIAEAFLTDNFYFVAESNRDITFMEEFYKSIDKKVTLELQETVGEGEKPFMVYKVVEQKDTTIRIGKKK